MPTGSVIKATVNNPYPWPNPRDEQNKADVFLVAYGVIYVIIKSKRPKGKEPLESIRIILSKMQK